MEPLPLHLDVNSDDPRPLYLQIAAALRAEILSGRLRPGTVLPGTRSLAGRLKVSRFSVVSAFDELVAEGWLKPAVGAGTAVADPLPEPRTPISPTPPTPEGPSHGFDLPSRFHPHVADRPQPEALDLRDNLPDPRLLPEAEFARAYRGILRSQRPEALQYGSPKGHEGLRQVLADMLLHRRGLQVDADQVLLTRGTQNGLDLLGRALLKPGDWVAVENPGNRRAWDVFRLLGAEPVPVPVDELGLRTDALADLLARNRIRMIYVTPNCQNPTGASLAPARRQALLDLAARHRVAVIEDDFAFELHYTDEPVLPLASQDRSGVVVYLGSFTRVLAPALRLGFLTGPHGLVDRLASLRLASDWQGDRVLEGALREIILDGTFLRHVRKTRAIYRGRRDRFLDLLAAELPRQIRCTPPAAGLSLWATLLHPLRDLAARCSQQGLRVHSGSHFSISMDPLPCLQLGFAALEDEEQHLAIGRLALAMQP